MTWPFATGAVFLFALFAAGDQAISPGKPVSHLQTLRWIQGEPIESFEPGRVYVLEFWSTWCGACVESIEYMNEAARRHASDATFVAIHIWQREGAPTPEEFLNILSDAGKPVMQFAVADDVQDRVSKSWMDATENAGLPTAMIVDRESRLAWFGTARQLEGPLNAVIAGTFDYAAATAEMNRRIHVGRLGREADAAITEGEYDRGMELMLEAIQRDTDTVAPWIPSTYGHLVSASRSPEVGGRFIRSILQTTAGKNSDVLAGVANAILHFRPIELRDLGLARSLAEKANAQAGGGDPHLVSLVASVRAEQGDLAGAIRQLELSLQTAPTPEDRSLLAKKLEELRRSSDN